MKKIIYVLITLAVAFVIFSCQKHNDITPASPTANDTQKIYTNFPETFESASKTTYAAANVTLTTGSWNFNDALIGTSSNDHKTGSKAARIENTGLVTMNFDVTNGASLVSLSNAKYGSDASSTWELDASVDGGISWAKVGSTITTSSTTLNTASFAVTYTANVRFQVKKLSGGRLDIDNFSITDNAATATRDDNLGMGNPSNAVTNISTPDNYLMVKTQYVLSFNNSKGEPNWVSWHLSTAWKGTTPRCNCFSPDGALPSIFYHTSTSDYTNSGFDRGHMCPSEDRDGSSNDNAATFLMTNIVPQAPINNQQTWVALENYARTLINAGNELYIISGGYGSGGTGSLGGITYSIASGHVNVPAHVWKVIVVLPIGSSDVSRVTNTTRVIAVDMPNTQTVNSQTWGYYRVSVDTLETITGYDFLSNVPVPVQGVIESTIDSGPTQ